MNRESLRHLPILVASMDENLFINITEFINNPLLREFKLQQAKLIEVIKSSPKYHYDNKTGTIKFKEKADRNILMIRRFIDPKDECDKLKKEEIIKCIIEDFSKNYFNKIKNIDKVEDSLYVVFEHENIAVEVEKYFLEKVLNSSIIFFNKYTNNEKYIIELQKAEVCLAAESLKRRVVSNFDPKYTTLWSQIQYINGIVLNPTTYIPRRFTNINKNSKLNLQRNSNKNNEINNEHKNNLITFEDIGAKKNNNHSNSVYVKNNNNTTTTTTTTTTTNYSQVQQNLLAKPILNNTSTPSTCRMSYNKFDQTELIKHSYTLQKNNSQNIPYSNNNSQNYLSAKQTKDNIPHRLSDNSQNYLSAKQTKDNMPHRHSDNIIRFRKFSNNNNYIAHSGNNQMMQNVARMSVLSIQSVMENPRGYKLSMTEKINKFDLKNKNVFSYSNKEIWSVYFHMNFLKKLANVPSEFKDLLVTEIMTEVPKTSLESLKMKKADVEKFIPRERSKTIIQPTSKRGSSMNKNRLSGDLAILHNFYGLGGLNRKRNTSLKINKH